MPRPGRLAQLVAAAAFITTVAAGIAQAAPSHRAGAGDCGEYMYRLNGHCVDARIKPARDWTANVYL